MVRECDVQKVAIQQLAESKRRLEAAKQKVVEVSEGNYELQTPQVVNTKVSTSVVSTPTMNGGNRNNVIVNQPPPVVTEYRRDSAIWASCILFLRNTQVAESSEVRAAMFSDEVANKIAANFGYMSMDAKRNAPTCIRELTILPRGWVTSFSALEVASILEFLFPRDSQFVGKHTSAADMLKAKRFDLNFFDPTNLQTYSDHLDQVERAFPNLSGQDLKLAVDAAIDVLKLGVHNSRYNRYAYDILFAWCKETTASGQIISLLDVQNKFMEIGSNLALHKDRLDAAVSTGSAFAQYAKNFRQRQVLNADDGDISRTEVGKVKSGGNPRHEAKGPRKGFHCDGCGRHLKGGAANVQACNACSAHPERNTAGWWRRSTPYKQLQGKPGQGKYPVLPVRRLVNGEAMAQQKVQEIERTLMRTDLPQAHFNEMKAKNSGNVPDDSCFIDGFLTNEMIYVQVLIDTGAVGGNFIGSHIVTKMNLSECRQDPRQFPLELTLGGSKWKLVTKGLVTCNLTLKKDYDEVNLACLNFHIIESQYDVIIGLQTIREYGLIHKFLSLFGPDRKPHLEHLDQNLCSMHAPGLVNRCKMCCNKGNKQELKMLLNSLMVSWEDKSSILRPTSVQSKEEVLGMNNNQGDDILMKDHPWDDPEIHGNPVDLISFEGSDSFKQELRTLCLRYEKIFSDTVKL
jgi:hypothetical protein